MSKSMKNRINAFEMWYYRRMLKVKYTEHISNSLILIWANANRELLNTCRIRKMKYFGHILRAEGQLATICMGKLEGKKARGRQRLLWTGDIFDWAGTTSIRELCNLAKNRQEWRAIVANPQNWGRHPD